jgi:hypothetical protein
MINPIVYTVTVIDLYTDKVLGIRRTPAIFTQFKYAEHAVKNNSGDLSDGLTYQYAVIEETVLNIIRPCIDEIKSNKWWYKYNSAIDEFEVCNPPIQLANHSGFGIG